MGDTRVGKSCWDSIQLLINDHARQYVVRGLIPNSAQIGTDAILMDIGAAQLATGKSGHLDRILIKVPDTNTLSTCGGASCSRRCLRVCC